MQLKNGTILQGGKYRIRRLIGAGGFGCTYEAWHTLLDSRVALKEFFVSDFCNRDDVTGYVEIVTQSRLWLVDKLKKKFVDEARILFKMKHPGIVRVIDVFEENGTAYYAMEYIQGMSLEDLVRQRGTLTEYDALNYICQVAEALKYVHSLNCLHLDIKPGNIMLNAEGKAILIDFGASKHYDAETGENTSTLLGINTNGYAPVEQVNQCFTTFSPATDIYALGATLYRMLTGMTPVASTMLYAQEATLAPLPSYISASMRKAVTAAMQPMRRNRPQTVDEWMKLLPKKGDCRKVADVTTIVDSAEKSTTQNKFEIITSTLKVVARKRWKELLVVFVSIVLGSIGLATFYSNTPEELAVKATECYEMGHNTEAAFWNLLATCRGYNKENNSEKRKLIIAPDTAKSCLGDVGVSSCANSNDRVVSPRNTDGASNSATNSHDLDKKTLNSTATSAQKTVNNRETTAKKIAREEAEKKAKEEADKKAQEELQRLMEEDR
ncbi:MAG: serine/threonine protein kinase [Muribaculaceae bacterium]